MMVSIDLLVCRGVVVSGTRSASKASFDEGGCSWSNQTMASSCTKLHSLSALLGNVTRTVGQRGISTDILLRREERMVRMLYLPRWLLQVVLLVALVGTAL